ncbi:restriction endonuclease subunit S [Lactobacillus delbrueckii subsp. lactis]|uniref:restriction endonuclease subunit S n=1 Tax=Lactobacillus delbrueckii TaxID=1584 RepID=UPI001E4B91A2|nr:restriction endonuclease subunit S [Lactobacillus delbrueckii]MCD5503463.1 restriction endonuclease subunit S [Lactobacillus delbrueckii subsp. lactis]
MKDEKKAPKLRFKGFTDDWEQVKYGEIFQRRSKMGVSTPTLPSVEYDDINPGMGTLNKEPKSKGIGKRGIYFNPGDVLFGKLRPYLKNWLFACFEGVAVGDFWVLTSSKIDHGFTYSLIQTPGFQYIANLSSGSKMPRSDWGLVSNARTFIPINHLEQERISSVLFGLDHAITLHEEKKRQLERLKSALMQKMFADKSGYPAVRFYGFSDKWEKRKLGDIFEERIEKSHNGSEELLSVTLKDGVVKAESLDRKNNASHDKRNYKLVFPNDIAYNSMRMWQGALGVSKYNGIVSPAYTIIKLKNQLENPCFYQNYFKKYEILNVFRKSSQGLTSDTWNLKYPLFSRIHLFTTSSAEQQNISSLLTLLDYNIALHGYKLELLKKIKKFLLQSMFI